MAEVSTNEPPHGTLADIKPAEPSGEQGKRAGRRPKPWMVIVVLLVLGGLGWLVWHLLHAGKQSTDDAIVEADVVPLAPRVAGQVVHLWIQENQAVHKGDPILAIDDRDYVARLHDQQAAYDAALAQAASADDQVKVAEASATGTFSSATAQLHGSTANVESTHAQTLAAAAQIARARSDVERTSLDLQRARQLYATHAIPKQQLDNARTAHEAAVAALRGAKAQLVATREAEHVASAQVSEAEGRLGVSRPVQAEIDEAQANAKLAHAKADSEAAKLAQARLQVEWTNIYAPADGVVSSLGAHVGQYLQAGEAVAQFVPDETYVVANFKETQLNQMQVGQRAWIKVDAYPGRKIEARVESFSGGTGSRFALIPPDNATGNFVKITQRVPVRLAWVHVPKNMPPLRAGLSVEVTVHEHEQVAAANPPVRTGPST